MKTFLIVAAFAVLVFRAGLVPIDAAERIPGPLGSALRAPDGTHAPATLPGLVNYQGRLLDPGSGDPVADATYSVRFSIWDASTAGTEQWNETQNVTTSDGVFSVLLGNVTPLPVTAFNANPRYLEVKVGADAPMTPRQQFTSVAYAFFAGGANLSNNSELLDSLDSAQFLRSDIAATKFGDLTVVNGATSLNGGLLVNGTTALNGSSTIGNTGADSHSVNGNLALGGNLLVAGTAALNNNNTIGNQSTDVHTITGNTTFATTTGTTAIAGNATIGDAGTDLHTVNGNTAFNNNVTVSGTTTLAGPASTSGNLTIGGDATVSGQDVTSGAGSDLRLNPLTGDAGRVIIGFGTASMEGDDLLIPDGSLCLSDGATACPGLNDGNLKVAGTSELVGAVVVGGGVAEPRLTIQDGDFCAATAAICLGNFAGTGNGLVGGALNVLGSIISGGAGSDGNIRLDPNGVGNGGSVLVGYVGNQSEDLVVRRGSLCVGGDGTCDAAPTLGDGAASFEANLSIGAGLPTDNDALFFDAGTESLTWNNTSTQFELSDNLVASGADLAERFPANSPDLDTGDLVAFDGSASVRRSDGTPYDARIAGIVSTGAGVTLDDGSGDDAVAVALQGRVPLNVTLENGAIAPGDYLTSSSTPGYAMKATAPGATVGIALEAFDGSGGDRGQVLTFLARGDGHTASVVQALEQRIQSLEGAGTSSGDGVQHAAASAAITNDGDEAAWLPAIVASGMLLALVFVVVASTARSSMRRGGAA